METDKIIEILRKGEKVKCQECNKGFYVTSANDLSVSKEFSCDKCGSTIRISPAIEVKQFKVHEKNHNTPPSPESGFFMPERGDDMHHTC